MHLINQVDFLANEKNGLSFHCFLHLRCSSILPYIYEYTEITIFTYNNTLYKDISSSKIILSNILLRLIEHTNFFQTGVLFFIIRICKFLFPLFFFHCFIVLKYIFLILYTIDKKFSEMTSFCHKTILHTFFHQCKMCK